MESLVNELENIEVLSKKDIVTLKNYIHKKYANFSSAEKSKILSKAVHQILDKNIKGLKGDCYDILKSHLLKTLISSNNQSSIKLIDILNNYLSLTDNSNDYSDSILNWLNHHIKKEISKSELETAFNLDFQTTNKIETPIKTPCNDGINIKPLVFCIPLIIVIIISVYSLRYGSFLSFTSSSSKSKLTAIKSATHNKYFNTTSPKLPLQFKYRDINTTALRKYLTQRHSLLASEPYFSKIIEVAKKNNLNPLVLFAISGQEQGFVPVDTPNAKKIANNPFNVYHSWKEYNTSIEDSTRIAAKTIINLCDDLPKETDPFHWINKKYAEDPNWGTGVENIFNELNNNL
ncbi:putative ABC transport system permease protein [Clostridium acetobutylicum]|uniref:Mannosyl-glycoprotein endo-beta-N-acetylglucosaminidase n=1 Tax=Clostridium acetobutylicum (strain ATCC 824 / DSM 792 / JCM 1419 / IAM 19013 / LMG 5710 / NBRC 13948 / NRRL B-527 / VKM B-1787 / 2291 / W) TaxID=272562 RepID=Q97KP6_CLOAB|nr:MULTISPECIES: glucosaminidase domain-containing protein [Clostridium]AAK78847.1 Hypothetical protein CA_C0871 [Clostridium acetobutylicum ATCC 824]AEI31483.1 hypothetical protein SMB_G0888 [Clostridium acetobutylicum DSM 1731]AWV80566.1 hypothetical protein DK921_10755 [Clostridium acetobutylicum]MBC2392756.1 glucosaminidase domain-containing protein [Clostridium acetobutylicum]MBC2584584.1 glucosaminidase domain-containing protein [Clostridium acetobutylicum]